MRVLRARALSLPLTAGCCLAVSWARAAGSAQASTNNPTRGARTVANRERDMGKPPGMGFLMWEDSLPDFTRRGTGFLAGFSPFDGGHTLLRLRGDQAC